MTRKELCERGESREEKGRGESKPIRWAASFDMTTAVCECVSVGGLGEDNGECRSHESVEETQL